MDPFSHEQPVLLVLPAAERVAYFDKATQLMRERKHLFSAMMVFEAGKSWAEADAERATLPDATAQT